MSEEQKRWLGLGGFYSLSGEIELSSMGDINLESFYYKVASTQVLKRLKVKEWSRSGVGDLRGGPLRISSPGDGGKPAPSRHSPGAHIHTQARKPGPPCVPSVFAPGTCHHRGSHHQDNCWLSLSISDCASAFSAFPEQDCQGHTHFSQFQRYRETGRGFTNNVC